MKLDIYDHATFSADNPCPLDQVFEAPESGAKYFVDFDHTLLLASSTERFLDCARPGIVFAFLLKMLGALAPWRLAGSSGYFVWRDWLRVGMVSLLAPWTFSIFKRNASKVFKAHLNQDLDTYLQKVAANDIVIVSFGFDFIVRALIKGTRYESASVVAPSFWQMTRYRRNGKILMLTDKGFLPDASKDIVITDSAEDDRDLLEAVEKGFVITWNSNNTTGALSGTYIPFFYTAKIKRTPGFFVKQVLLEEMAVMVFAFSLFVVPFSLSLAIALCFLFLANFIVYEIGYAENDRVGHQKEDDPKLSSNFFRYRDYKLQPAAWIWALLVTVIGVFVLGPAHSADALQRLGAETYAGSWQGFCVLVAIWMGVILVGRACFWAFNNAPLRWRVYLYLPLHITKYFGPILLFPLNVVGCALLIAQIIRTWALYAIRRSGGDVDYVASQLVRLLFFVGMLAMLAMSLPSSHVFGSWQAWALIAFCVLRAAPEMYRKLVQNKV